jgi:hypothetical protein
MQTEISLNGQVFTQSEIMMWDECPQKWFNKYQERLNLVGHLSWSLIVGEVWHDAMETLYRSKGKDTKVKNIAKMPQFKDVVMTSEIEQEIEYWQHVVEATLLAYAEFYASDFKQLKILDLERTLQVEFELEGVVINLAGKRDLKGWLTTKKLEIWDHKTVNQISKAITEGWNMSFQFMLYLWLDWKCSEDEKEKTDIFRVNAVKKTALRQKQGEGIMTFFSRVRSDIIKRPEEYFYRQTLDLTEDAFQTFEQKLLFPKLRRIATLQLHPELTDVLALSRNTGACNNYNTKCEYWDRCFKGETKQYRVREIKHEELAR